MSNPKVQTGQKSGPSPKAKPYKENSPSTFSEDEIRTRAYQIFESRGRTHNRADEDWSQAETELMELLHAK